MITKHHRIMTWTITKNYGNVLSNHPFFHVIELWLLAVSKCPNCMAIKLRAQILDLDSSLICHPAIWILLYLVQITTLRYSINLISWYLACMVMWAFRSFSVGMASLPALWRVGIRYGPLITQVSLLSDTIWAIVLLWGHLSNQRGLVP